MNRRQWITTSVAAGSAACGLGWAWWQNQHAPVPPTPSDAWSSMRFERPEGGDLALSEFKGQALLLNFWATWCPPCIQEMPLLDAFHREQHAHGRCQVLGLAVDQGEAVRAYLKRVPVSFPIGLAGLKGLDLCRSLGNPQGQLPFSVLWNRDHQPLQTRSGALSADDLAQWGKQLA